LRRTEFLLLSLLLLLPALQGQDRPRIGLVLSGGGAKGLALIPVLKMLDELDIPIDCIAGTSVGGIVGALYARGYSGSDLEKIAAGVDWSDMFSDRPPRRYLPFPEKKVDGRYQLDLILRKGIPALPPGLIFGEKFFLLFARLTFPFPGNAGFDQLAVPFRCVAVDLVTGRKVVLEKGSLPTAMLATMAIPTIFSPVGWNNELLADGGILDNLPVSVVKSMRADIIIAVDLASPLDTKEELKSADKILSQTLRIIEIDQEKSERGMVDVLVKPDLKGFSGMDFFSPERLALIKQKGEEAAEKSRPRIEALKEKYGLSRPNRTGSRLWPAGRAEIARQQENIVLDNVTVTGNTKLPVSFISRLFTLKHGDQVDGTTINGRIFELYSLGYFENIRYDVFPAGDQKVNLDLEVKELPRGDLRIGLRYDNFPRFVVAAGVYYNNLLVPGLRLENEIQLGGLTRFHSSLSYPSATLNFPLCPFLHVNYKSVPTRLYDGDGSLITTYKNRSASFGAGFSFLLKKRLNVEIAYEQEKMNVEPKTAQARLDLFQGLKSRLKILSGTASLDTLDDVWTPSRGLLVRARYEGSYEALGTSLPYQLIEASADLYATFSSENTVRLRAYWGNSTSGTPFYKWPRQGRPADFVGMRYDQLVASRMSVFRGEYRYKYNNFVYFKLVGNVARNVEQRWPGVTYEAASLWGAGLGLHVTSPAGPMELIFSTGSKSLLEPGKAQGVIYLVLGARF
jgi:NTE family protein